MCKYNTHVHVNNRTDVAKTIQEILSSKYDKNITVGPFQTQTYTDTISRQRVKQT